MGRKPFALAYWELAFALFGELLPDFHSCSDSAYNHKGTLAFALASLPKKRVKQTAKKIKGEKHEKQNYRTSDGVVDACYGVRFL